MRMLVTVTSLLWVLAACDGEDPVDASTGADARIDASADAFSARCSTGGANLLACYDFEDTLADGSGNGLDLSGNGPMFVAGPRGQALLARRDRNIGVQSDLLDFSGDFTVEALVMIEEAPAGPTYFLHRSGHFGISTNSLGELVCTVGTSDVVVGPTDSVEVGIWFHAACTYSAGGVGGYIDGRSTGEVAAPSLPDGSAAEFIAGGESNGDEDLRGAVDSVRIWTVALPRQSICDSANEFCTD